MSTNNINKLSSVEKLVQKLTAAEKTNQKEVRMTVQEVRELVTDLSILTSKLGKHIEEIHTKLSKIGDQSSEINVQMDGGTF